MSSSPVPAPSNKVANLYEFATDANDTKITYYPLPRATHKLSSRRSAASIRWSRRQLGVPRFASYSGRYVQGPTLVRCAEASGRYWVSHFFADPPPVVLGAGKSQAFTTYGVKTQHAGNIQKPGAQITYEAEFLSAAAKVVRPL
jgi:hypothetical protein